MSRGAKIVVVVLAVGFVGSLLDPSVSADGPRTKADSIAAKDSALGQLGARLSDLTAAESMDYDDWRGRKGQPLIDTAFHYAVLTKRLDSARALMRPRGTRTTPATAAAASQLAAMREPMPAATRAGRDRVRDDIDVYVDRVTDSLDLARRKEFAEEYERTLLRKGIDATVRLAGQNSTTLRVHWVLISRPLAFQLAEDPEFNRQLRNLGFEKVTMGDGDTSWSWDIR